MGGKLAPSAGASFFHADATLPHHSIRVGGIRLRVAGRSPFMRLETDLGGSPTEWNDLPLVLEEVRTLVQHGDDPEPWLPRIDALRPSAPPDLQRATDDFTALVRRYISACDEGSPDTHYWKRAVEDFPADRLQTPA